MVIELGAEKCKFSGGSLKRNLLVALPEPPEQQKPKKKEEEKQDIPSFALDGGIALERFFFVTVRLRKATLYTSS